MTANMTARKLYLGPLTDSRRWDKVKIRPDDVIVVTPPKSGTTWMQTIVALLLTGDPWVAPDLSIEMPWVDIRMRDMDEVGDRLEAMHHRRSMKSHTPLDGLPVGGRAQYLCVMRHPLDIHISFRNHVRNIPMGWFDAWYPEDDTDGIAFRRFLDGGPEGFDGDFAPLAHILRHYKAAKAQSDRRNVSLFHYADMKRDLPGTFARVAELLGVSHSAAVMEDLIAAATFDNMKENAERFCPSGGKGFFKSDAGFFHGGKNGSWRAILSDEEVAAYDAVMAEALPTEAREWLENGALGGAGG
ncbi:sulfotransferase domain-containing protein [Rhodobacteraceae bacterium D3-12]|nr:sulfotransferase domain-containing protein [Rhodobacteraceae bacterium D3-12]